MKNHKIVMVFPRGAMGADDTDSALESMLRRIALALDPEDKEWSSKYGYTYENNTFMMHTYCWCEEDECAWCNPEINFPNFIYTAKRLGKKDMNLAVWWYKYIGRDTKSSMRLSKRVIKDIEKDCIDSINRAKEL